MENRETHIDSATPTRDVIIVDFQKLLLRILSYWWLFAICLLASYFIGQFYLRYATPEYSSSAILLIKDAGKSGIISEQQILADQISSSQGKEMDNEIQILKSLTLMEKVVDRLNLRVSYIRIGNVKETELYSSTTFTVDSFQLNNTEYGHSFFVEQIDYETFLYKESEEDEGIRYPYDIPFTNPYGTFRIRLSADIAVIQGLYKVIINTVERTAKISKGNLSIERIGHHSRSSVLELKKIDPVPERARDILNALIDVYNEEEIQDENTILRNTLEFIDYRVASLVGELDSVEGGIQRFKSANEIINDNASSSMNYTLGEMRNAIQRISDFEIQKSLLESIESFLIRDDGKFELIPANLIAENPVLSGFVNQFNTLVLRNNKLTATASERNPIRIEVERELIDLKSLILETVQNLKKDLQIPIQKIERNIQDLRSSMNSIPSIEKKLIEKMRMQAVKEKLFLFLLQKREETALSEAITTAKTRTIDRARVSKTPVYPKPKMIKMASLVLGFLVPLFLVMILGLFETKVDSEETIKSITNIPILGRIAFNKGGENVVVKHGSRSAINEMFRLLRTNLNFINHDKEKQIIMMTSSISGEGKTFISLNLGITLALSGKKVILISLDLRKPKLAKYLGIESGVGATNYLVGQNSLREIINNYGENENFDYITSGPIPPNPAELILSQKMQDMLTELQEHYDYILLDTPPLGLVSDALLLRKYIDNICIVVRHNFTRKVMVKNLENMFKNNELEKSSIIFNGVKKGRRYYGYGGYYYGKDQSYYVEE